MEKTFYIGSFTEDQPFFDMSRGRLEPEELNHRGGCVCVYVIQFAAQGAGAQRARSRSFVQ
jgi:hypothetical protein